MAKQREKQGITERFNSCLLQKDKFCRFYPCSLTNSWDAWIFTKQFKQTNIRIILSGNGKYAYESFVQILMSGSGSNLYTTNNQLVSILLHVSFTNRSLFLKIKLNPDSFLISDIFVGFLSKIFLCFDEWGYFLSLCIQMHKFSIRQVLPTHEGRNSQLLTKPQRKRVTPA